MEQTKVALKHGMRRINRALKQSKSNHLLYLTLFVICIFFLVYFWTKVARWVRWFV